MHGRCAGVGADATEGLRPSATTGNPIVQSAVRHGSRFREVRRRIHWLKPSRAAGHLCEPCRPAQPAAASGRPDWQGRRKALLAFAKASRTVSQAASAARWLFGCHPSARMLRNQVRIGVARMLSACPRLSRLRPAGRYRPHPFRFCRYANGSNACLGPADIGFPVAPRMRLEGRSSEPAVLVNRRFLQRRAASTRRILLVRSELPAKDPQGSDRGLPRLSPADLVRWG